LYTGIPLSELISQGFYYFVNSIKFDPMAITLIFGCIIYIFYTRKKDCYVFIVGLIIYLCYVIYIGGDFMGGRFFSLPFIFSLTIILTNVSLNNKKYKYGIVAGLIAFILLMPKSSVMSGADYTGIADPHGERGIWRDLRGGLYTSTGLWRAIKGEEIPKYPKWPSLQAAASLKKNKEPIFLQGAIGVFGYYAGPSLYVLDPVCLPDPFRSRLNIATCDIIFWKEYKEMYNEDPPIRWRPGHYYRPIPSGYALSILQQQNLIDDPNLNKYYAVIRNIIQDDIFSVERFANILKMNLGFYNDLIKHYKNEPFDVGTFYCDLVSFDTTNIYYYWGRGDHYMKIKNYYEAIQDYSKYIEVEEYNGEIWYRLAVCLFYEGDYNNAYVCWENAKDLEAYIDPSFEEALNSVLQKQNH
jgi:arabinofuranosyltransferase